MKVDIIIAGAQKCGTTALFHYLSKHPRIIASENKELNFFNYSKKYLRGEAFYHSNFKKPGFFRWRKYHFMEASPSYIGAENVELTAKRINDYNPKAKIIILLRNPINRAFSAWQMYKKRFENGKIDWYLKWHEDKLHDNEIPNFIKRDEKEFKDFYLFLKNEIEALRINKKIECNVLDVGNYIYGIKPFLEKFGNNVKIIRNEDMLINTESVLSDLCDFLNLKQIDWYSISREKIFDGKYKETLNKKEKELLKDYYRDSLIELLNYTGIKYL